MNFEALLSKVSRTAEFTGGIETGAFQIGIQSTYAKFDSLARAVTKFLAA